MCAGAEQIQSKQHFRSPGKVGHNVAGPMSSQKVRSAYQVQDKNQENIGLGEGVLAQ